MIKAMTRLVVETIIRVGIFLAVLGTALFGCAGTYDWPMAWAYLGVHVVAFTVGTTALNQVHPGLLAERMHIGPGVPVWDFVLVALLIVSGILGTAVVAGLDVRWAWSYPLSLDLQIAAYVTGVLGYAFFFWAMLVNKFFSSLVRLQKERGHIVITGGPYRFVRHPGYTGFGLFILMTPVLLGSLWALVPAGLGIVALIVRTAKEDKFLHKHLEGYADYACRVRNRLVPGVW